MTGACGDDSASTVTAGSSGSSGSDSGGETVDVSMDAADTTGESMRCGDGRIDEGEDCDDGNEASNDGCSPSCEFEEGFLCEGQPSDCFARCGDALIVGDEECDDDNVRGGDGCSQGCDIEDGYECEGLPSECETVCGDGLPVGDEGCDDGDLDAGDGCDAACAVEEGFVCEGTPSACAGICGDGRILGAEECDDFNEDDDDGCDAACTVEEGWSCGEEPSVCMTGCGDGIPVGMEGCDDMNVEDGDGCDASCQPEPGYTCEGSPSVCTIECGDGVVVSPEEECDDGGVDAGDGCSETCAVEPGYTCMGQPSNCIPRCGDGVQVAGEACDDGNIDQGDGCSLTCQVEFGWQCAGEPSTCSVSEVLDRVSLGVSGGCVLTTGGELGCFASNIQGEAGIGLDNVAVLVPAYVLDDVVDVSSGQEHRCALRGAGDAWCWGDNSQAQLGSDATLGTDELSPIQIAGLPVLTDVASGDDHNCGRDMDDQVWCWGANTNLQLGRGGPDTTDDPVPATVALPGGLGAIDMGLGDDHSCVVLEDGTVACWGDNDNGQLGGGEVTEDSPVPVMVLGLTDVVDVQSGNDHSCARTDVGALWCWGDNIDGQLGDGTTNDSATPLLTTLPAAAEDVSLGDDFTCALLVDDSVYCWGEGADFQLGNGDLVDTLDPTLVLELPPVDLVDIEVGGRGVCVVSAAAERYCWGYSENGLLGIAPLSQLVPRPVTFSGPVQQLVLNPSELRGLICGIMADGSVECSGDGSVVSASTITGSEGLFEPIAYHLAQPTPLGSIGDVQDMGIGDGFACAATSVDVQCWGDNSQRQLGQGGDGTADILVPSVVVGLGAVDQVEVGDQFACVRVGGSVWCWGDNSGLQTSEGSDTVDQSEPRLVPGIDDATDIALGEDHVCALRATGAVRCWGEDSVGQLGDGDDNEDDSAVPVDVTGLPPGVSQIAVGHDHACALAAGEVYCWGSGMFGNLGQGNEISSDTALLVPGLAGITRIVAGANYTCALDGDGAVACWGESEFGQLGDGGRELTGALEVRAPTPFMVASGITDLVAGNSSTCVQTADGWGCVGFRASGQLGNGTTLEPAVPTRMMFGL